MPGAMLIFHVRMSRNYITGEDLAHFLTPEHAAEAMEVFDVDHNNKVLRMTARPDAGPHQPEQCPTAHHKSKSALLSHGLTGAEP